MVLPASPNTTLGDELSLLKQQLTALEGEGEGTRAVDNVSEALSGIHIARSRIAGELAIRAELIHRQLESRDFYGADHEEYHRNNELLLADLTTLFSTGKTLLNRVAGLYAVALKHEKRRGLQAGSFGKFVHSLESEACFGGQHEEVRQQLLAGGKLLDDENNQYRDKYIEHVSRGDSDVGLSTMNGVRRVHTRPPDSAAASDANYPDTHGFITWLLPEGQVHWIHVTPRSDLTTGTWVARGEPIGHVADGGKGHFLKYVSHYHVWGSCDIPATAMSAFAEPGDLVVLGTSPDALTVSDQISEYIRLAVSALQHLNA